MQSSVLSQSHLSMVDTVNYGSYYTPQSVIDIAYDMLEKNIPSLSSYKIIDTSCGYGNFLRVAGSIGADYDACAIQKARSFNPQIEYYCKNALFNVARSNYGLSECDKIIVIGNPPYNDKTSLVRNKIKAAICEIDSDIAHRDLGISFLLSYNKLTADYVCVLHPLSYLIKEANFKGLKGFKDNYILLDGVIISSGEFEDASKTTHFPIIIALYKRKRAGMSYSYILNHTFRTKEGRFFRIEDFDTLNKYVTKYPNHSGVSLDETVAFFMTMRDINALKRNKTFLQHETANAIRIPSDKLSLYCYADVFKNYISHIPYYFGNCDIFIDYSEFKRIESSFLRKSVEKHIFLKDNMNKCNYALSACQDSDDIKIESYLKKLLGEHYVY